MGRPRAGRGQAARARGAGMVKLDKKLLLAGSTAMVGGYAGVFLVAPILSYKLFFRGGLLPGVPVNEEVEEEPTKAHAQANRWYGLMMLQNVIQTVMMTNNFEENLDTGLKVNAITWSMAAAMHVPAMMNKTQPKELCLQQLVVMPLIAAASFMATRD